MQSHHPNIHVERDGDVATVTLDRPETKNACTGEMWVAIGAAFREIAYSGARAAILTGAGGNFCAGADISGGPPDSMGDGATGEGAERAGTSALPPHNLYGMRVLGDVVLAVHDCPIPVVAKVEGFCVGAGFGLALAADMIWCADTARFSAIFAKRGLSLDFGTSWLLRERIGLHKAKELAFTAKIVSGAEAAALGFVNAAVPADELDQAVRDIADAIAAGPPIALSMTKRELDNASTSSLTHALEVEALAQSVNVHTEDLQEALTAWVQRRPPKFTGR
jgi:2-(1,2-epoxy-1,2-dihydrophenyl)acetyl-CoA isomerase